jgi:hypothetical protein
MDPHDRHAMGYCAAEATGVISLYFKDDLMFLNALTLSHFPDILNFYNSLYPQALSRSINIHSLLITVAQLHPDFVPVISTRVFFAE